MKLMSNSQPEVDKEQQYGEYMGRTRWMDKLFRKGCHKALDIPEDDMNFNQQHQGITGKSLVGLGGLVLAGLLGWHGIDRLSVPATEPPAAVPSLAAPQEYEVHFWAEDGTEIKVLPE
jgi:hypothetical protein